MARPHEPSQPSHARTVETLLETVLPGDERFPSAASLPLSARLCARAASRPGDQAAFQRVIAALGATDDPAAASEALSGIAPEDVRCVLQLIYPLYYARPEVRKILATEAGYPDRPPQPGGYDPIHGFEELASRSAIAGPALERHAWWKSSFGEVSDGSDASSW